MIKILTICGSLAFSLLTVLNANAQNDAPKIQVKVKKFKRKKMTQQNNQNPLNIKIYNHSNKVVYILGGGAMLPGESDSDYRKFIYASIDNIPAGQTIEPDGTYEFQFTVSSNFTGSTIGAALVNLWLNNTEYPGWAGVAPNCQIWIPSQILGSEGLGYSYLPYDNQEYAFTLGGATTIPAKLVTSPIACTVTHPQDSTMQIDINDISYP